MSPRAYVAVAACGVLTVALLSERVKTQAQPARGTSAGTELPAIVLQEAPAFPLPAHVESDEIAAGGYTFARLFAAGEALFARRVQRPRRRRSAPCAERLAGVAFCAAGAARRRCARLRRVSRGAVPFVCRPRAQQRRREKKGTTAVNIRSVTSLFGDGDLQLLAQEMTEELQAIRDGAAADAKRDARHPRRP